MRKRRCKGKMVLQTDILLTNNKISCFFFIILKNLHINKKPYINQRLFFFSTSNRAMKKPVDRYEEMMHIRQLGTISTIASNS